MKRRARQFEPWHRLAIFDGPSGRLALCEACDWKHADPTGPVTAAIMFRWYHQHLLPVPRVKAR